MPRNVAEAAPEGVGAPEPEIEITPEMIEAGEECLNNLIDRAVESADDVVLSIPKGWVKKVYLAMQRIRNRQLGA